MSQKEEENERIVLTDRTAITNKEASESATIEVWDKSSGEPVENPLDKVAYEKK